MGRKGVSLQEKRERILRIYHESKEVFNLKEVEKLGSKAGVDVWKTGCNFRFFDNPNSYESRDTFFWTGNGPMNLGANFFDCVYPL
ncbi:Meiotic nuclear division protein [Phytophthora palmivora]|uniref:Meiotic nuclear division protein n=1 Tax=Phytophthora palmivora TaxID=4796 RepID=A0A2P4YTY0_9STRA|nr:Meiotic nuclear division protein [Phytophthora palmivora]